MSRFVIVLVLTNTPCMKGSLEAFAYPSLHTMVSKWVPEDERSAFISFAYVGGTFGSVITNPLCGLIISHLGWEVRHCGLRDTELT